MSQLAVTGNTLPATAEEYLEKVAAVEAKVREMPQIYVQTEHILHGGMYARTVRVDAGVLLVGVLIKVPTVLVANGHFCMFAGDCWHELKGYNAVPASAGRKVVIVTMAPTEYTMLFPSKAQTVEEAEAEFTDDTDGLISRKYNDDIVVITGEPCPA